MTTDDFADVLAANEAYAAELPVSDLEARAARGLAVLTCMDSRIEPLAMLGLVPGDAKILRNAGAPSPMTCCGRWCLPTTSSVSSA